MIFYILLTHEQYWTVAFLLFQTMLFYTVQDMFRYPDEVGE
jgi:hypothetical protein